MLTLDASETLTRPDRRPHAVIVGSGFGGLAAAIRLGARGYRVDADGETPIEPRLL